MRGKRIFLAFLMLLVVSTLTGCIGTGWWNEKQMTAKVNARMDGLESAVTNKNWEAFASHLDSFSGGQTWQVVDEDGIQDLENAPNKWKDMLDIAYYVRDELKADTLTFVTRNIRHWKNESVAQGQFQLITVDNEVRIGTYQAHFWGQKSNYRMIWLGLYFAHPEPEW